MSRYLVTAQCDEPSPTRDCTLTHTSRATVSDKALIDATAARLSTALLEEHTCSLWDNTAKVWNKQAPSVSALSVNVEPVKRRKAKGRTPQARFPRSSDRDMERKAVQYAEWLATRDGIALPNCYPTVHAVTITNRAGKLEGRIRAVTWREAAHNDHTRAEGRYGHQQAMGRVVTIDLPNWDWCPAPYTEETLAQSPEERAAWDATRWVDDVLGVDAGRNAKQIAALEFA